MCVRTIFEHPKRSAEIGLSNPNDPDDPPDDPPDRKGLIRQFGDNVVEPQFVAQMTQAGWGCIFFFNTTAKEFQSYKGLKNFYKTCTTNANNL